MGLTPKERRRWRPSGWINPYLQQDDSGNYINSRVYEAGADAMLEALKTKYGGIMTEYHVTTIDKLKDIIERAYNERLDMIIQREYCGYVVEVWKG